MVLRPHIVYGPGDTTLLPRLLAARRGGVLLVPGDGRTTVSVTHVENLADAVALALRSSVRGGAFNVSDAAPITVDELLRTVLARTGTRARIRYLGTRGARLLATVLEGAWRLGRARSGPPLTHYVVDQLTGDHVLDITRARTLLGYAPRLTVHDGPLAWASDRSCSP
jgi:nucleoside-diphosphate-sugar epimerase